MPQVTVLTGAVWGFVGAVSMVLVMRARGDTLPPFAVFWAEYLGDSDPAAAMPQSLLLHAVYAVIAGMLYALIFRVVDFGFPITGFVGGIVWGLVWAIVLDLVAGVFWLTLILEMDPERPQVVTMGLSHLGYGLTLGVLSAAVPHPV